MKPWKIPMECLLNFSKSWSKWLSKKKNHRKKMSPIFKIIKKKNNYWLDSWKRTKKLPP